MTSSPTFVHISTKETFIPSNTVYLLLFFIIIVFSRLVLRGPVLELDEAEQILLAGHLKLGYASQPPLYTWLQYFFFLVFGKSLLSITLLKALLLSSCVYAYYQLCHLYCKTTLYTWCALLSWVFIPNISFELLKDNTHSILALLCACLTWLYTVKPARSLVQQIGLLSLSIGCGFLSKFNYWLFFIPFLISSLYWSPLKQRQIIVISLLIGFCLALPYFLWLINHLDLGLKTSYKLVPTYKPYYHGIVSILSGLGLFIAPFLWVNQNYFSKYLIKTNDLSYKHAILFSYFIVASIGLILLVACFKIRSFESRWLIPVFFSSPLLTFSRLSTHLALRKPLKKLIIGCLIIQFFYVSALVYRSHQRQHQLAGNTTLFYQTRLTNQV